MPFSSSTFVRLKNADGKRVGLSEAAAVRGRGGTDSVVHRGVTVADTGVALRVLETSHPPVYYVPREDVTAGVLVRSERRESFCEFKGMAGYWDLLLDGVRVRQVAWSYERPVAAYAGLAGYVAFYASKVEECWVGDERVQAQEGDFYGGWITRNLRGPFKGGVGTLGW